MKTCVLIPAYNEAKTIAGLIKQLKEQNLDVLIVDDGSTDNTFEIAKNNGAAVLRNVRNKGKGASLVKGIDYALSAGFDAVLIMDADGQHKPQDIPCFLNLAGCSNDAVFIGNRMLNVKNMPWLRFLTNKFMSWFISVIAGQDIPDTQCGFRLIKRQALEKIKLQTDKFEAESELLIKAARLGFKIKSVPVTTVYASGKSRIKPFVDTARFIRFIVKEIF